MRRRCGFLVVQHRQWPTDAADGLSATLERALGISASMNMMEMQPGDVPATSADTSALRDWVGFAPDTRERVMGLPDLPNGILIITVATAP